MNKFTKEQLIQRAFERVSIVMYGMWQEKGSSDTRLLLPPLIPDEYVIVGESVAGKERREHVIPRNIICYECHEMFKSGKNSSSVAEFIRKNLLIVYISKDEQERLDSGKHLNLRQRMPDGWSFSSGDIFARLKAANIKVIFYQQDRNKCLTRQIHSDVPLRCASFHAGDLRR